MSPAHDAKKPKHSQTTSDTELTSAVNTDIAHTNESGIQAPAAADEPHSDESAPRSDTRKHSVIDDTERTSTASKDSGHANESGIQASAATGAIDGDQSAPRSDTHSEIGHRERNKSSERPPRALRCISGSDLDGMNGMNGSDTKTVVSPQRSRTRPSVIESNIKAPASEYCGEQNPPRSNTHSEIDNTKRTKSSSSRMPSCVSHCIDGSEVDGTGMNNNNAKACLTSAHDTPDPTCSDASGRKRKLCEPTSASPASKRSNIAGIQALRRHPRVSPTSKRSSSPGAGRKDDFVDDESVSLAGPDSAVDSVEIANTHPKTTSEESLATGSVKHAHANSAWSSASSANASTSHISDSLEPTVAYAADVCSVPESPGLVAAGDASRAVLTKPAPASTDSMKTSHSSRYPMSNLSRCPALDEASDAGAAESRVDEHPFDSKSMSTSDAEEAKSKDDSDPPHRAAESGGRPGVDLEHFCHFDLILDLCKHHTQVYEVRTHSAYIFQCVMYFIRYVNVQ